MGILDSIVSALGVAGVDDEKFYAAVAQEISEGVILQGLWAKALCESDYEENRSKARYIKLRVDALKKEVRQHVSSSMVADRANNLRLTNEQKLLEDDAYPAYQRGDYQRAFAGFSLLAQKGQAWAQNWLGVMYERGHGVQVNLETAVAWYRAAAAQNDMYAQYNLGMLCLYKFYDYVSAEIWFGKAEVNKHPHATAKRLEAAEFVTSQKRFRSR